VLRVRKSASDGGMGAGCRLWRPPESGELGVGPCGFISDRKSVYGDLFV
jgi:hypothetical protein